METKEPQEKNMKDITSILSLLSLEDPPIIHQRRAKSDPIPVSHFSFQNSSEKNISDEPLLEYRPEIKSTENPNKLLLGTNSYGFKGRSPYVSSSSINISNIENDSLNSLNKNDIINTNNAKNSNEKIINGFIFTELKDKVFEYRCSVCNFVANSNNELRKHLVANKHFILPKKCKKNNKSKMYHKKDNNNNRLNQTFMFSMNKPKKYSDKKIVCKHCYKRFESNYALNSHLNAHKFKCDICYKLFNNKEDLMEHKHNIEEKGDEIYSPIRKKKYRYYKEEKNKIEIDDWEEASSNKKEKKKDIKKDEFGESYAFTDDNDDGNIDFNKMVKIRDGI